jgi:hypothetical protein
MGTQYLAIRAKLKPRTVNQIGNPTDYISQNSEVNVQEKRNDNGHTKTLTKVCGRYFLTLLTLAPNLA